MDPVRVLSACPANADRDRKEKEGGRSVMGSHALRVGVLVNDAVRDEPWLAELDRKSVV